MTTTRPLSQINLSSSPLELPVSDKFLDALPVAVQILYSMIFGVFQRIIALPLQALAPFAPITAMKLTMGNAGLCKMTHEDISNPQNPIIIPAKTPWKIGWPPVLTLCRLGVIKDVERAIPKKTHGRLARSLFRVGLDWLRSLVICIEKKFDELCKSLKILTPCKSTC